uniref:ZP domain-containing protein n=1 Tax=Globodera rostochiensis TaxID=31243 RepID=A0A914I105_GLORO
MALCLLKANSKSLSVDPPREMKVQFDEGQHEMLKFDCLLAHDEPKGIFLSIRLIVSFHAQYLSKFDRVFDLRCFYMEMEHELEKQFTVSMDPPAMQAKQISMPNCRYEVLSEGPQGPPVYYATIGQMVYHKWTCEAEEPNQFCMIVHSCIVDDGNGDKVELIDKQGCARDKYLLQNLEYVSDLMVGKEAHVYKYADRQSIYFDCKIALSIKEPSCQLCPVPNCPDPPRRKHYNFVSKKRKLSKRYLIDAGNKKHSY